MADAIQAKLTELQEAVARSVDRATASAADTWQAPGARSAGEGGDAAARQRPQAAQHSAMQSLWAEGCGVASGDYWRAAEEVQAAACQAFARFQDVTGTALPDPGNPEAEQLRVRLSALRTAYEAELQVVSQAATAQQEVVRKLVDSYEEEAKGWVERHEDALQLKFLAQDMAKEARRQRDNVEELMDKEMLQYSLQAKDCAAQLAMVVQLARRMRSGEPFEPELSGLLAFQRLSKLANAGRDTLVEPTMIHEQIKFYAEKGTPTKSQLYHRFEELHPRLNALNWHLPDAGLVGRVWEKASSRLAAEDNGLATIRGYLAQGNPRKARDWLQHWMTAHVTLREATEPNEVVDRLQGFASDLDVHLRSAELSRYLQAKMLAQQKSLLQ